MIMMGRKHGIISSIEYLTTRGYIFSIMAFTSWLSLIFDRAFPGHFGKREGLKLGKKSRVKSGKLGKNLLVKSSNWEKKDINIHKNTL